jgi:Spy/CpxP family protein refolding chaperone
MRSSARTGLVLLGLAIAPSIALAQHAQPYAGQQSRDVKALSEDEVKQYLAGGGMGYAKPAELNGYPGPMHVLELAEKLQLDARQRQAADALMQAHKAEARAIGSRLVDAEGALDALFRSGKVGESELAAHVRAVASIQGEYRLSHLDTHRRMHMLLTPEQVARYNALRGYGHSEAAAQTHQH